MRLQMPSNMMNHHMLSIELPTPLVMNQQLVLMKFANVISQGSQTTDIEAAYANIGQGLPCITIKVANPTIVDIMYNGGNQQTYKVDQPHHQLKLQDH